MLKSERFSAFYFRDFRLFWLGQVISFSGTWMHATAQGWLVYSLTRSPFYLGMVSAASSLPILLFSLFGGAVADRFKKRNLLLVTQACSIAPALLLGALTSLGTITVWQVMALGFALGTINAFDIPARQSFLIELVERGNLLNAIAMNSAAFNGARLIGPVIGGVIIAEMGIPACFYLNALSFLAVLVALSMIRAKGEQRMSGGSILGDIYEGVGFIRSETEVLKPMLLVMTFSTFGLPFVTLLPVFADDILAVGPKGLGFLLGASGAGALVSALVIAFKGRIAGQERLMGIASVAFPLSLVIFASSRSYPISLCLMVIAGLAVVAFLATANNSIQLRSPDQLRGRVMSVYTFVFLGMMPIGNYMMGSLAAAVGTVNAVRLAASFCLAVSLSIVLARRKR